MTTKPKLLIVEDDEGLSRQYRWAFPEYDLLLAHSREAARASVEKERPPVGILDLGLPPDPDGASEGLARPLAMNSMKLWTRDSARFSSIFLRRSSSGM